MNGNFTEKKMATIESEGKRLFLITRKPEGTHGMCLYYHTKAQSSVKFSCGDPTGTNGNGAMVVPYVGKLSFA